MASTTYQFIQRSYGNGIIGVSLVAVTFVGVALWIGFPVHFPDSGRYLMSALQWRTNDHSPVVLPILLRPLILWFGPWAFVVMNMGLLSGVSIALARSCFGHNRPVSLIVALLLSGAGVMVMTIMMDIQTVIGAIAIMVLVFRWSAFCWIALVVGLLSHSSAVLILPILGLVLAALTRNRRLLKSIAAAVATWAVLSLSLYWILDGEWRLTPRFSVFFAQTRIMWDVPESIRSFAEEHPGSATAEHLDILLEAAKKKRPGPFLWGERAAFNTIGRERMAKEGLPFIIHSISNHPAENIRHAILNPYKLLVFNFRSKSMRSGLVRGKQPAIDWVERAYPEFRRQMERGLQFSGKLEQTFPPRAMVAGFYISLGICLLMPVMWLSRRRPELYGVWFVLPVAAVVYVLISAFVAGNFNALGTGRLHVKLLYVPILVSILVLPGLFSAINRIRKQG